MRAPPPPPPHTPRLSAESSHHRTAQALYFLYRVFYLWESFSSWHMAGLSLLLSVYAVVWFMLSKAAAPV